MKNFSLSSGVGRLPKASRALRYPDERDVASVMRRASEVLSESVEFDETPHEEVAFATKTVLEIQSGKEISKEVVEIARKYRKEASSSSLSSLCQFILELVEKQNGRKF